MSDLSNIKFVSGSCVNHLLKKSSWIGQFAKSEQIPASVVTAARQLLSRCGRDLKRASWLGERLTVPEPLQGVPQELVSQALALLGRGKASSAAMGRCERESALLVINGEKKLTDFPIHLRTRIEEQSELLWRSVDAKIGSPIYLEDCVLRGNLAWKWNVINESFPLELGIKPEVVKERYTFSFPIEFTAAEVETILNPVLLDGSKELRFLIEPSREYDGRAIVDLVESKEGSRLPAGIQSNF